MEGKMRWCANAREVGSGKTTVVLAHGYGADQGLWDNLVPSLSQTNKVLLFDWDFAAGEEEDDGGRYTFDRFADDLIALMDEKEVRGAVVVGHSMSAMAACIASVRRPELFAHLVLLCASPRYINSEEEGYVGGFERAGIDGMLDAMASDFDAWVRGFVPNAAGDPESVPHLEKSFLAMRPAVALEVAKMIFLGDQRDVLDDVTAPCTIVQVNNDFAAPPSVAEYMQRRMKGAEVAVEIIDSVGHFPQLVAPQQLLDILHGVLLRQPRRRARC
ncbi:hypothetical protein EJB05_52606 [Eragrostis curvula]|uniref:AB hydrolase-1 domain-containing protein n=1 Tax=Eragrostis curvula TaxID=38414 RepID=A0A5J9SSV1_9POAL|nr:hypothetical protein EJB05_52606 [Eragrostis curvula]